MSETFIGKPAPAFKGTAVVDGEFKDISLAVSYDFNLHIQHGVI